MRFGTMVLVLRGSTDPNRRGMGRSREVVGVLVGAMGQERYVRLLDDDPYDTVGWNKAGCVGHWSSSCVRAKGGSDENTR